MLMGTRLKTGESIPVSNGLCLQSGQVHMQMLLQEYEMTVGNGSLQLSTFM